MKKLFTTLFLSLIYISVNAQAPNWLWAKSAVGTGGTYGGGVSTDAGGNVFMTGSFSSPTITFGTTTLTNAGYNDIFIVKYDAAGNVLWAKSAGGIWNDYSFGVSTDAGGNVFITGSFSCPTITFGSTTLVNTLNVGYSDIFIVKYDASGNVLWAKSGGGTDDDGGWGVSTDAGGNVFITGEFRSPTITFGTTTLTNAGVIDIFIVKYNAFGIVLWAKSAGGPGDDRGFSVSTDAGGNVFITGFFSSPTITFGTTTLTNAGLQDIFIVKYDALGNVLWAKSAGGTSYDEGQSVSTDAGGNVFITGYFSSPTITFGTTTLGNSGAIGHFDVFIAKYDASGNALWAKSAGGSASGNEQGMGVSTDAGGNVFITGYFSSPTITFGTTTLTNSGGIDIFIVKYDAAGNVLWAESVGGSGTATDEGMGVSTDAFGNVFITGYFSSPTITFGTTTLTNSGGIDIFIAKLDSISSTVGIAENTTEEDIGVYPNPTSGQFTIILPTDNAEIKVTNTLGQQILKAQATQKTMNLQLNENGVYIVNITTKQGTTTRKLIVNR